MNFVGMVAQSPRLTRRAAVINAALELHIAGRYNLSIPLLFKEFEGIFTELLVITDMAGWRKGKKGKLLAKDNTGSFATRVDKNGNSRPIELPGLVK